MAHTGPIKTYRDTGEPLEAENLDLVFKDGVIQMTDKAQTINVCAHASSSAVILVEFRECIIAAFKLSSDCGLLVKHLNERGDHIPDEYRKTAVALLLLPDDGPFSGFRDIFQ